jgi:hypothetical protein
MVRRAEEFQRGRKVLPFVPEMGASPLAPLLARRGVSWGERGDAEQRVLPFLPELQIKRRRARRAEELEREWEVLPLLPRLAWQHAGVCPRVSLPVVVTTPPGS